MNFSRLVAETLWGLPLVLQAGITVFMGRHKLVKVFPFFFSYSAVVLTTGLALIFLPYGHRAYALVYWSSETLAVLLGLAVIFEILGHVLPKTSSLKFISHCVWILGSIAAVAALLILIMSEPLEGNDRVFGVIMVAERSVRFLQASLLIIVTALMSRLGLTWRDESVGIAAGFGIYSALALGIYQFGYHWHLISGSAFVLLNSAAYNVAVIIWGFCILRPPRLTPVGQLPKADVAEWNSAVTDYLHQWSRHS